MTSALSLPDHPTRPFPASSLGPGATPATLRRLVKRGELVRLCPGVYARSVPPDPVEAHLQLVQGCRLRLPEGAAAGHLSAAVVHGLALAPWEDLGAARFVHPGPGRGNRTLQVSTTRLPRHHVVHAEGGPVTSLARTIVDIGRTHHQMSGELAALVVADSALAGSDDPARLRVACEQVMADLRGCQGMQAARTVLRRASPYGRFPEWTISRWLLQAMGLPSPVLNLAGEPAGAGSLDTITTRPGPTGESSPTHAAGDLTVPFSWPTFGVLGVVLDTPGSRDGVPVDFAGSRTQWIEGPRRSLREAGWVVVEWSRQELDTPVVLAQRLDAIFTSLGHDVHVQTPRLPWHMGQA